MLRIRNDSNKQRRLRREARDLTLRFAGKAIPVKKAFVFSNETILSCFDEMKRLLRTGRVSCVDPVTRQVVTEENLDEFLFSGEVTHREVVWQDVPSPKDDEAAPEEPGISDEDDVGSIKDEKPASSSSKKPAKKASKKSTKK